MKKQGKPTPTRKRAASRNNRKFPDVTQIAAKDLTRCKTCKSNLSLIYNVPIIGDAALCYKCKTGPLPIDLRRYADDVRTTDFSKFKQRSKIGVLPINDLEAYVDYHRLIIFKKDKGRDSDDESDYSCNSRSESDNSEDEYESPPPRNNNNNNRQRGRDNRHSRSRDRRESPEEEEDESRFINRWSNEAGYLGIAPNAKGLTCSTQYLNLEIDYLLHSASIGYQNAQLIGDLPSYSTSTGQPVYLFNHGGAPQDGDLYIVFNQQDEPIEDRYASVDMKCYTVRNDNDNSFFVTVGGFNYKNCHYLKNSNIVSQDGTTSMFHQLLSLPNLCLGRVGQASESTRAEVAPICRKYRGSDYSVCKMSNGVKIVTKVMPSNPYTRVHHNDMYSAGIQYMNGKTFNAATMRMLTYCLTKKCNDANVVAIMVELICSDADYTSSTWHTFMSRGWWNIYGWISDHNERVDKPFRPRDKKYLVAAAATTIFFVVMFIIYRLRRNVAKPSAGLLMAPKWLLISFAAKFLYSKLSTALNYAFQFNYANDDLKENEWRAVEETSFMSHCNYFRELKECDADAIVEIVPNSMSCNDNFGNQLFGIAVHGSIPVVARSCTHNEEVSVVNRACMKKPEHLEGIWSTLDCYADELFKERLFAVDSIVASSNNYPALDGDPPEEEKVYFNLYSNSEYNENAVYQFEAGDMAIWLHHLKPSIRDRMIQLCDQPEEFTHAHTVVKSFIKRENVLKFENRMESDFDPRAISGRTPQYQLRTGPITYAISKALGCAWGFNPDNFQDRKTITYAAGMSCEDISDWFTCATNCYSDPVFIESDANRFDASVSTAALKFEMRTYKNCGIRKKYINKLKKQYSTFGCTPHGVKYKVPGTRKSGDGNTSCGNSLLNGLMTYAIMDKLFSSFHIIIMGDDVLVITEGGYKLNGRFRFMRDCDKDHDFMAQYISDSYAEFGFNCKVHVYRKWDFVQFCSGRFYPVEGGHRFAPKIGRLFCKLGFSKNQFHKKYKILKHAKSVALGLQDTVSFLPIVRAYISKLLEIDVTAKPLKEDFKFYATTTAECNSDTLDMISRVYGVTIDQIYELEDTIVLTDLPCVLNSQVLTDMVDIDNGDSHDEGGLNIYNILNNNQQLSFAAIMSLATAEEYARSVFGLPFTLAIVAMESLATYKMHTGDLYSEFAYRAMCHGALHLVNIYNWKCAAMMHTVYNFYLYSH